MSVLRPVATAEGSDDPDDLSTFLEFTADKGDINEMSNERVGCHEYMTTWNYNPTELPNKLLEEGTYPHVLSRSKDGEPRHRLSLAAIVISGQSPYAAVAVTTLLKVLCSILHKTKGWVRHDRVDALWLQSPKAF